MPLPSLRTALVGAVGALILIAAGAPAVLAPAFAQERSIVMASTTSTEQSGLFSHLLPAFKQATGIDVRVVAVGTGQALDIARRGDAGGRRERDEKAGASMHVHVCPSSVETPRNAVSSSRQRPCL